MARNNALQNVRGSNLDSFGGKNDLYLEIKKECMNHTEVKYLRDKVISTMLLWLFLGSWQSLQSQNNMATVSEVQTACKHLQVLPIDIITDGSIHLNRVIMQIYEIHILLKQQLL